MSESVEPYDDFIWLDKYLDDINNELQHVNSVNNALTLDDLNAIEFNDINLENGSNGSNGHNIDTINASQNDTNTLCQTEFVCEVEENDVEKIISKPSGSADIDEITKKTKSRKRRSNKKKKYKSTDSCDYNTIMKHKVSNYYCKCPLELCNKTLLINNIKSHILVMHRYCKTCDTDHSLGRLKKDCPVYKNMMNQFWPASKMPTLYDLKIVTKL